MIKYMAYKFFGLLLISFNLSSNYSGDPGEVFAVKLNQDETSSTHLIIEKDGDRYAMIALPYDKQGQFIKFNDRVILINKKDFGESRITIKNASMVDLSPEDSIRTREESKIINKALKNYSTEIKSYLNFIKPVEGIISSRYGKKRYINESPRSPHLALDIAAPIGTEVIAPENGKVILIGEFFYSGNYLILDHGYGLLSSYSHLSKIDVSVNQFIEQGKKLGEIGATGRVTGPHLHWSVYLNNTRINPESIIKKNFLESLL
jgi:murein DD-endopeptidase MepM/ murein hydrolase activator NlpD